MNKKAQILKFILADLLSAAIAWSIFFFLRKNAELQSINETIQSVISDRKLYTGLIFSPGFWLLLYTISGSYHNI